MLRAIDVIGEPKTPIELNSLEIDNSGKPESGSLRITRDSSAVLSKSTNLPELNGFTADGCVTNTSLMVLSLAPYLDLTAKFNGEV